MLEYEGHPRDGAGVGEKDWVGAGVKVGDGVGIPPTQSKKFT